ncbi:hypothetical protein BH09BAC6_BH09BAC6_10110 [soil metagenome]|jgi:hypothetical protein
MTFYMIFFLLICAILLLVTLAARDIYPFSHYPMFAGRHQMDRVKVIRLALETETGEIEWWQHEAYRYPEMAGRKLSQLHTGIPTALTTIQQHKLLLEILRLLASTHQPVKYKAFHLIERTVNADFTITNKTVEIISFNQLQRGKI